MLFCVVAFLCFLEFFSLPGGCVGCFVFRNMLCWMVPLSQQGFLSSFATRFSFLFRNKVYDKAMWVAWFLTWSHFRNTLCALVPHFHNTLCDCVPWFLTDATHCVPWFLTGHFSAQHKCSVALGSSPHNPTASVLFSSYQPLSW